jgi:hypothetical protein
MKKTSTLKTISKIQAVSLQEFFLRTVAVDDDSKLPPRRGRPATRPMPRPKRRKKPSLPS